MTVRQAAEKAGRLPAAMRACAIAAALLAGMVAGADELRAQTGIFRLFAPQQKAPAEQPETVQRFADAEEEVVATGAPLTIRPAAENIQKMTALADVPLPPRRPAEFPPRVAAAPAANGESPKSEPVKALAGQAEPADPAPAAAPVAEAETPPVVPPPQPRLAAAPASMLMAVEGASAAPTEGDRPQFLAFAPQTTGAIRPLANTRGLAPQPARQAVLPSPLMRLEASPGEIEAEEEAAPEPVHVEKQTDYVNIACLDPHLLQIIHRAGQHFGGKPVITSGLRTNGKRGSYHRRCQAADFFVPGIDRAVLATWLRTQADAGGVGTYCHTKSVHLDMGEPRNWTQCGFRFRFALRGGAEKRG